MNGVRRFLGGGLATSPPSTPEPDLSTQPLSFSAAAKSNWPPTDDDPSSAADPPTASVSSLTIRKNSSPATFPDDAASSQDGRWRPMDLFKSSSTTSPPSRNAPLPSSSSPPPSQSRTRALSSASQPSSVSGRSSPGPTGNYRPSTASTSELGRRALQSNPMFKRTSAMFNSKDELLFSLLASEAVVDSREFEILSAEEVEECKREEQALASRLATMKKKLALETKIRDAAKSLARVNGGSPYKNGSKQSSPEQVENANRKVEAAQKELWSVSERYNLVTRRLNEHRAGVLSYSVRNLESQLAPASIKSPDSTVAIADDSSTSGNSTFDTSGSPSSSATSVSVVSKGRFDGAHLFAGHKKSVQPRKPLTPAEASDLEDKLRQATEKLKVASQKQAEMARDLSYLRLEKEQAQMEMEMELQNASETITELEEQAGRMSSLESEMERLTAEREEWEMTKRGLEEKERLVERLEQRLRVLEDQNGESVGMESALAQAQAEVDTVREQLETERRTWERERVVLEEGTARDQGRSEEFTQLEDELRRVNVQMRAGQDALQSLMLAHNIQSEGESLAAMMSSVSNHLVLARSKAQEEIEAVRRRLEEDVNKGMDKREQLASDLEQARREREEARSEIRMLEGRLRDQDTLSADRSSRLSSDSSTGDMSRVTSLLQPVWAMLPSPEARIGKLPPKSPLSPRPGASPTLTPVSPGLPTSISDLDVRALKTLYDTTNPLSYVNSAPFSLDAFAQRVSALIVDDRALIERLVRFAQAHDLLKKNAERAQKLAQESNHALETYQRQVNTLESRAQNAVARQTELQDAIAQLEEHVERLTAEKVQLERRAAENEDAVQQLTEANNALSAKTLTLAEEAANAPLAIKKQMEEQLAECKKALAKAEEEIEAMRMSDQSQAMALLEELNSVQTENGKLMNQLRALKK